MTIGTLVLAVIGLILLRPALRLVVALVDGGRIGARALAKQPATIHLVEASAQAWRDPAAAERLREPLLHAGYEPAGTFRVNELPDVVLCLMVHLRERASAMIYEHPKAGTWLELACRHQDGTGFAVTSGADTGIAPRPGFPVVHLPGTGAAELQARLLVLRPAKERVPVDSSEAAGRFERAYSESMAWRREHGISRGEVARIAVTGVKKNKAA
jgi:hypothetical protein